MLAALSVEFRKLNASLAALLALVAPALIAVLTFFMALRLPMPRPWDGWLTGASLMWAYFMLPMSVTALTALVANMEHGPRSWDYLRSLSTPRWRLYGAKAVCVLVVIALMSAGVLIMTSGALLLAGRVNPARAATGALHIGEHAAMLGKMYVAALLMVALQLWAALRFSSFVPALALGIGGTFFAVAATQAREGVFLPWQMPVNILATTPWRWETALALGGAGGLVVLVLMLVHLSRREVL